MTVTHVSFDKLARTGNKVPGPWRKLIASARTRAATFVGKPVGVTLGRLVGEGVKVLVGVMDGNILGVSNLAGNSVEVICGISRLPGKDTSLHARLVKIKIITTIYNLGLLSIFFLLN
jgi:hypothetical protein